MQNIIICHLLLLHRNCGPSNLSSYSNMFKQCICNDTMLLKHTHTGCIYHGIAQTVLVVLPVGAWVWYLCHQQLWNFSCWTTSCIGSIYELLRLSYLWLIWFYELLNLTHISFLAGAASSTNGFFSRWGMT